MRFDQFSVRTFFKSMIGCLVIMSLGGLWLIPQAQAFTAFENDAVRIQIDSTLSLGAMWRVESRDKDIIGLANGGSKHSVNMDDGNLYYDTGLISNAIKMTTDLDVDAQWIGAFVRASGFYDYENEKGGRERTDLTSDAKDAVGSDIDFLDYYIWVSSEVAGMPFQVRVGDQVVSWGESTFIQHSINSINSVDVSKLRVPGAELKEALTPEGMVWATISPTDNLSIEVFYEYDWEETKLDPMGTYFSGADFIGDGIKRFPAFDRNGTPFSQPRGWGRRGNGHSGQGGGGRLRHRPGFSPRHLLDPDLQKDGVIAIQAAFAQGGAQQQVEEGVLQGGFTGEYNARPPVVHHDFRFDAGNDRFPMQLEDTVVGGAADLHTHPVHRLSLPQMNGDFRVKPLAQGAGHPNIPQGEPMGRHGRCQENN